LLEIHVDFLSSSSRPYCFHIRPGGAFDGTGPSHHTRTHILYTHTHTHTPRTAPSRSAPKRRHTHTEHTFPTQSTTTTTTTACITINHHHVHTLHHHQRVTSRFVGLEPIKPRGNSPVESARGPLFRPPLSRRRSFPRAHTHTHRERERDTHTPRHTHHTQILLDLYRKQLRLLASLPGPRLLLFCICSALPDALTLPPDRWPTVILF
jgi:hypothetical protein